MRSFCTGALVLLLLTGCAGRGGNGPAEPVEEGKRKVQLPGQERAYPSEDPRNCPAPGRTQVWMPEAVSIGAPEEEPAPIPETERAEGVAVQVFATVDRRKADRLRESLDRDLDLPVRVDSEQGIWKVRVGPLEDRLAAEALRRRLIGLGYEDAFLVELGVR
ncbi:MAG: hypothetical protein GF346_01505 [Candidatus Eisenbacteria bacterium]|nr:hypothetical protein [Candidatus Latescibacterota bacterium]MBD3301106.1 hypothetical protein [Candidatus Eisenbacteria bacterium]